MLISLIFICFSQFTLFLSLSSFFLSCCYEFDIYSLSIREVCGGVYMYSACADTENSVGGGGGGLDNDFF